MKTLIRLMVLAVLCVTPAFAATHTATSCSQADVQAAVNSAAHGDIVQIPAGTCTWTTEVVVNVGITLQGAGQGATTLIDNVIKNGSQASHLLSLVVDAPNNIRLTALTIRGQAADLNVFNQGHILISGTMTAFRVDHISFTNPQTSGIRTGGCVYGLIDHVTFTGNVLFLENLHAGCEGSSYGDGSWATPIDWGGPKAIYVEDSTFTATNDPYVTVFFDGFEGQRVVIRNNSFTQGSVGSHGTDSGQRRRGTRQMEVYSNTFTFPPGMAADSAVWIRGGTGVVFNNTVTAPGGLNGLVKLTNCRDANAGCGGPYFPPWGACDGLSPYDQNTNGQDGYRCVDQPGAGTSNNLEGLATPTPQWVGNVIDPIYVWNNSISVSPTFGLVNGSQHVVQDRDFYIGTPRPEYTPYIYPHPLRADDDEEIPPPPPTPFTVSITSPVASSTVSGKVAIEVAVSNQSSKIYLYIDNKLQCTAVEIDQLTCNWNTNPFRGRSVTLRTEAWDLLGIGPAIDAIQVQVRR